MTRNKKAQTELIVNVVVGLIAIIIIFVLMYFMSSKLEEMKYDEIRDVQKIEVMESFLPMLSEMNSSTYANYSNLVQGIIEKENGERIQIVRGFLIGTEYETYKGDIAKSEDFNKIFPNFKSEIVIPNKDKGVMRGPTLALVDPYIYIFYANSPETIKIGGDMTLIRNIGYVDKTQEAYIKSLK